MKQFKFISIVIGITLSVFLGEIIARVYFFGNAAFSYSKTNSFGILNDSGLLKYSDSKELTYELIPNLNTKYKLHDFKTNAEGFRDRNHERDSNALKIAVLGDSFTMGTGVSQDKMYVSKTESQLNQFDDELQYEVFNFGVAGYSLTNYKTVLERNALKHNPDLIVIGFCASNDHYRIGKDFTLNNFNIKPKKNMFWDSYLKKLLIIKLNSKAYQPISYEKHHLQYIDKQFQIFQDIFTKNKSKGLVFYMDLIYDPIRVEHIKVIAEKNELSFLDISEFFQDENLSKYIVNELDSHPNGKANQIFAEKLTSYILANQKDLFKK